MPGSRSLYARCRSRWRSFGLQHPQPLSMNNVNAQPRRWPPLFFGSFAFELLVRGRNDTVKYSCLGHGTCTAKLDLKQSPSSTTGGLFTSLQTKLVRIHDVELDHNAGNTSNAAYPHKDGMGFAAIKFELPTSRSAENSTQRASRVLQNIWTTNR